jgi:xylulokinase
MNFLGIDLGTSELKVLLLGEDHTVLAQHGVALEVSRPHALWSEQDPAHWWQAACTALDQLSAMVGPAAMAAVAGIGLSGQMHGAVVLDTDQAVLRPAILWNDGRSAAECDTLMQRLPALPVIAGNLAMPGFTAPKLVWLQRHEPEVFARTDKVLLPKDWLRLKLTDQCVSEMSDAAGTLWLDVARRCWSPELLAASGLGIGHMPRLVEGSEASGQLRADLARRWGLSSRVVVAGGAGDNAASAVGIGAVQPGSGFVSLGTSGVLFVTTDRFRPNPALAVHAFCHALPGRWHQMSVMLAAASCLQWAAHLSGGTEVTPLLAEMARLDAAQMARAPLFLPYLSGERTPHNDPLAQGALVGLSMDHGRADLAYAVMEGVSFGLLDGLQALQHAGTEVQRLSLVGGGARSPVWAQQLASAMNLEIVTHVGGETGAALGAARLAWLACGGDEAQVCTAPQVAHRFVPRPDERDRLMQRHPRFAALYPALLPTFHHAAPSP